MIRIVTDSSCDLTLELVTAHHVELVPFTVRFGEDEYLDGVEMSKQRFWERLATSPVLPETSAPSAGRFLDAFRRLADEGAKGILALCLSSDLSAAYQSASIAAEKAGVPVRVVDSRMVSMALGLQVIEAAVTAESGAGLEEVTAAALSAASSTNLLASLDTVDLLRRGGVIGRVPALLAGLVEVKPLISLSDGVLVPAGRVRTSSRARAALARKVAHLAPRLRRLAVLHSGSPGLGDLVEQVRAAAPGVDPLVAELGPVVATHAGPGALGVAYHLA